MRLRASCGIVLLVAGAASAAQPPDPAGLPDLLGPRALGLSAAIGIAASNEGIYLNPASAGARKRYSVEGLAFVDRRGAETDAQLWGASVVDSQSAPVAGGVSFVRAQRGAYTGDLWHLVVSGPIAQDFHLGVAGKYLALSGPAKVGAATVDAGIFWQVTELLSLGAVGYDLVSVGNAAVAPMGAGAGIGIGNDRTLQVTADWRADFDRAGTTTNRYAAGVEVLLGQLVPVRAGWSRDEILGGRWWSAGVGLVSQTGVALDVGYRQSLDDSTARTVAATLKLFLFQ